ncbi:polyprotein [Schistosoma japonicum]|uniref:Polyprotein n=1 Tax=Schistosoma japonicum TaxID=6182 RepID=A0A4Z2DD90_SCHJA|nr:polyprotein [Schistosoma japonicum]
MAVKYINLIKALYSNTTCRVRAYGELSSELITSNGVCQGSPPTPLLYNFILDMLLKLTFLSEFSALNFPGDKLVDLKYAEDIVLLGEDSDNIQRFFNHPKH